MNFILDSSFCGAFILPDEQSERVDYFFETAAEDSLIYVPCLFWFEISNMLSTALKRGRIKMADIGSLPELLPQSKISTDYSFGAAYAKSLTGTVAKFGLSSYDAAYLELALRKEAALGTLDDNLAAACGRAGLTVL